VNRAEIAEKLEFHEGLFDRIAGRHKRMGLMLADFERRITALEEKLREMPPQPPAERPLDPHWDVT
jgi:hypothetical protein